MVNKYYLVQDYMIKCIKKQQFRAEDYDEYFSSDYDYLYKIWFIMGYKDNKIYFPYIQYEKENDDGKFHIFMEDMYITEQYYNIYINYDTIEDVYNFIKSLLYEFPKDILIPDDIILITGIIETDWEKSNECRCEIPKIHIIKEQFTLEDFINKIDNIVNVDKYLDILKELYQIELNHDLTKPYDPFSEPSYNDKLKQDYPNLKKWL